MNLYVIVQAQTQGSNNAGPPNPSETVSQASNLGGVNREQMLQQTLSVNTTPEDLQVNRQAFQSLPNHFGDIGPLLFDLLTNENALGEEFSRVSKIITLYLDLDRYRHSLATIFELAENIEFSQRLGPLFNSISDIQDSETKQTFGQAVEIIMNILSDESAISEIRSRITSPAQVPRIAF
ncbi:hypothetical protein V9T40_001487 [Parthenolecanium corni]|uniref:Uncharacterized protein n=1 Tax=Parthenolecanium corni TaxID=536013 RepID=A0AAN9TI27_9HEMI